MLSNDQLQALEQGLWTSTTAPEAYRCLQELKSTRAEMGLLITAVYAVLAENYGQLEQSVKLDRLEEKLTLLEEQLQ